MVDAPRASLPGQSTSDPATPDALSLSADMSVTAARRAMRDAFARAGLETPDTDARFLLCGVANISPTDLMLHPERPLGTSVDALRDAAAKRCQNKPVSRILGWRAFYGRRFEITEDVLDPRPDSETLVDVALELIRERAQPNRPFRIADIGAGSGALIVTLLAECDGARGIAVDISQAALDVVHTNAKQMGVLDRLDIHCSDGLRGLDPPIDMIVSNPPYIASNDIAKLALDVRGFDPALALDGGPDGLVMYRQIAKQMKALKLFCPVILELGVGQSDEVRRIFEAEGCQFLLNREDLGGVIRVVALERLS